MFADTAEIEIKAGKGGDGRLSFRHEKYRAMGGPDGGDGGHGGDVILVADHNSNTLSKFRTNRFVKAEDGQPGGPNRMHGKAGVSNYVKVPTGTLVRDGDTLLADLSENGQEVVVARGGRAGFGNAHFTASTRQAPRMAERGEPGEARTITLELKLVADIGLVGLPNAGKSTLLSVISNAKPEIADYPFTTLVPNLGVVDIDDTTMLVADIPGLIEGASQGKGLGDEFLRHIERTAVVLHLIDSNSQDIAGDWQKIDAELRDYGHGLSEKPQLVVLTKVEGLNKAELAARTKLIRKASKQTIFAISSQAHLGLAEVLRAAAKLVITARAKQAEEEVDPSVITLQEKDLPDMWQVLEEGDGVYRVTGGRIEGFARRTEWTNRDGVQRLRDIMRKTGIAKQLLKSGAQPGDTIKIGDNELEWR